MIDINPIGNSLYLDCMGEHSCWGKIIKRLKNKFALHSDVVLNKVLTFFASRKPSFYSKHVIYVG